MMKMTKKLRDKIVILLGSIFGVWCIAFGIWSKTLFDTGQFAQFCTFIWGFPIGGGIVVLILAPIAWWAVK